MISSGPTTLLLTVRASSSSSSGGKSRKTEFLSKILKFSNSIQLIATVVLLLFLFVHSFQLLHKFHLLYKRVGVRDCSGVCEEHSGVLSRNDHSGWSGSNTHGARNLTVFVEQNRKGRLELFLECLHTGFVIGDCYRDNLYVGQ